MHAPQGSGDMADKEASLIIRIKKAGGEVLDRLVITLDDLKTAVMAIPSFFYESVLAFKEAEDASNQLNQSLIQQGIYTKTLRDRYDAMADSLAAKSLYDDDQITAAQAIMQAQLGEIEVSEGLMRATMDLATAKKMDLASAADKVAKSIGTSTNALGREGVEIDASLTKHEKMAQVIDKLNDKWGKQAEAATKNLGKIEMLKKEFENLKEVIGEQLAPAAEAFTDTLRRMIGEVASAEGGLSAIHHIANFLSIAFDSAVTEIMSLGNALGGIFKAVSEAGAQAMVGNWKAAFNIIKEANTRLNAETIAASEAHEKRKQELFDESLRRKFGSLEEEYEKERESKERKRELETEFNALGATDDELAKQEKLLQNQLFNEVKNQDDNQAQLARLEQEYQNANTYAEKLKVVYAKRKLMEDMHNDAKRKGMTDLEAFEDFLNSQKVKNTQQILGQIATLQSAHSKELVVIGKAAAMAMAIINTAQGVTLALATFPGPVGIALGALVAVAGAVQ